MIARIATSFRVSQLQSAAYRAPGARHADVFRRRSVQHHRSIPQQRGAKGAAHYESAALPL